MYEIYVEFEDRFQPAGIKPTLGRAKQTARNKSWFYRRLTFVVYAASGRFGERIAQYKNGEPVTEEAPPF